MQSSQNLIYLNLRKKILKNQMKVGIVGLGYVGLNLLYLFSKKRVNAYGFDKNLQRINHIKKNKSYVSDLKNNDLKDINKKNLFHTRSYKNIKNMDVIIITVPTPLAKNKSPDLKSIEDVILKIKKYLNKGQCIILESTVYPGVTNKIIGNIIKKKGLKIGENIFMSYSPERISPGDAISRKFNIRNIAKVVSGYSKNCLSLSSNLYKKIFNNVIKSESLEEAEMSKLLENSYRSVNISLVNEIKIICDKVGLNINKVIDLAKTKPYGFTEFRPGPGIGGHCIPIDPLFLSWYAKKNNVSSKFIEHSGNVNIKLQKWIFNKIKKNKMKSKKKSFNVFFIGVTYKKNINDDRESPAINLIKMCLKNKISVQFNDPYINQIKVNNKNLKSTSMYKNKKVIDLAILTVDHDIYDFKKIYNFFDKILDTRGKYYKFEDKKIIHA